MVRFLGTRTILQPVFVKGNCVSHGIKNVCDELRRNTIGRPFGKKRLQYVRTGQNSGLPHQYYNRW